ncbi:spermidine/putrescine ABC transporter permease [Suicoccus acidiformans]|uniref:Spermidine/putrescine ABC transporter permease n=1 Tax=Suicoccus acidiformans TaxID=2036206 RepID=A0A347WKX4_9LACT|nr:ABC transporter permease [Suicoccus acidiformans]AXY25731.1 spermidine/putrescine ABC transporter permease [Suicoccus acidiformans]
MISQRKWWFVLPGTVLLLVFLILPLISILWPTFYDGQLTLSGYIDFFGDSFNRSVLWRTIRVSLLVTLLCILFGLPTSFYISRKSAKTKGILMALVLFPMLINSVVRSFSWINILGNNGIINNILVNLRIVDEPIQILYTEFSVIIGSMYLFLPLMITTLIGVLDNIPGELLEASSTLGATPSRAFKDVVIPLSVPGIIVGSILVFTGTLTAYTTPQMLGGNQRMMLSTLLYQNAMTLGNWQDAGIIALVMIAITYLVMQGLNYVAGRLDRRSGGA